MVSREMKEVILRYRLIELEGTLNHLVKGKGEEVEESVDDYAKEVMATFDDDGEFNRWCRQALGFYPDDLLKGKELTLEQFIKYMNEIKEEAIKKIEKETGIKFERLPIHVSNKDLNPKGP